MKITPKELMENVKNWERIALGELTPNEVDLADHGIEPLAVQFDQVFECLTMTDDLGDDVGMYFRVSVADDKLIFDTYQHIVYPVGHPTWSVKLSNELCEALEDLLTDRQ